MRPVWWCLGSRASRSNASRRAAAASSTRPFASYSLSSSASRDVWFSMRTAGRAVKGDSCRGARSSGGIAAVGSERVGLTTARVAAGAAVGGTKRESPAAASRPEIASTDSKRGLIAFPTSLSEPATRGNVVRGAVRELFTRDARGGLLWRARCRRLGNFQEITTQQRSELILDLDPQNPWPGHCRRRHDPDPASTVALEAHFDRFDAELHLGLQLQPFRDGLAGAGLELDH